MNLTCGKVPGTVKQIVINTPATVLTAMQTAASVCNFTFSKDPYGSNGKEMIDVPFLNGRELAVREGEKITLVLWDTPVSDGDIILLVPKIKGNQFLVTIAHVPGERHTVALLHASEPEAQPGDGTVANALQIAGIRFDAEKEIITVDGKEGNLNTVLENGDEILINRKPEPPAPAPIPEPKPGTETEDNGQGGYLKVLENDVIKIGVSRDKKRLLFIFK